MGCGPAGISVLLAWESTWILEHSAKDKNDQYWLPGGVQEINEVREWSFFIRLKTAALIQYRRD